MSKERLVFSLCLCLLVPFLGTYSWLHYEKRCAQKEIRERLLAGIDKSQLTHFVFSPEEASSLHWEHEREFRYQGEMYDLVSRQTSGDSLHLWCLADVKESSIRKQLDVLVGRMLDADPAQQKSQKQAQDFLKSLSVSLPPGLVAYPRWRLLEIRENIPILPELFISFPAAPPPSPPPQVA